MASKLQSAPPEAPAPDPYEALGVARTADDATIKNAYRKLALKYHPDKNPGDNDAQLKFQEVSQAYGILSDPELRKKYDQGGIQALSEADLSTVAVDVSQMGFLNTAVCAMVGKLGVPIKTVVADSVHMAVAQKSYKSTALLWNQPVTGRVGNAQAIYYTLDVSAEHIAAGFIVSAVCSHCKVKLLLWDMDADGEWVMLCQENAQKLGVLNVTSIHATSGDTLENVPRPAALALQQDPVESGWFKSLDAVASRERLSIKPGQHLLGVYGDNFFKKSAYTLKVTVVESTEAKKVQEAVDNELIAKRHELHDFEIEFRRVRAEFEKVVLRLKEHEAELDGIVKAREAAYLDLLSIPHSMAGTVPGRVSAESATVGAQPVEGTGEPQDKAQKPSALDSVFKAGASFTNPMRRFFGRKTDEKAPSAAQNAAPQFSSSQNAAPQTYTASTNAAAQSSASEHTVDPFAEVFNAPAAGKPLQ